MTTRTERGIDLRSPVVFNRGVPDSLRIDLSSCSYPIRFEGAAAPPIREAVAQLAAEGRKSVLLTDESVAKAAKGLVEDAFARTPKLVLPAGEKTKSIEQLGQVLEFMAAERVDRGGVLWVLGGGVIGDLGGFAAATYLRGIDFYQVPTTLLAMVDSSVGGKTGVNLAAGKNLAGAFHHPRAVYIAVEFLQTLPAAEFAAGTAEIIKYGLLGDEALFARLEREPLTPAGADLLEVIRRCCEMKAAVVQADERETAREGGRALLNLGHTFGHAIEQATNYRKYLHGEAVAVGLVAAARLSQRLGHLAAKDASRVERAVAAHGLPVALRAALPLDALMAAMQRDKKVRAGRLRFIVLKRLGEAATQDDVDAAHVEAVWRELGAT